MYLLICGSFMSAKNNWVHKSQIRKSQEYTVWSAKFANPQISTMAEGPQI
jgi:hypothetical protein